MSGTRFFRSEAIVISRSNYGEGDRLIKMYSYDYGKITVIAKGVRKTKSKKRGSIEIFSKLKFSAHKNGSVGVLNETLLSDAYIELRKSIRKVALTYFLLEVVDKLTQPDEPNQDVYNLLSKTLSDIQHRHDLKNVKNEFASEILAILGFWPSERKLIDPEFAIQSVIDRKLNSVRVGKRFISQAS